MPRARKPAAEKKKPGRKAFKPTEEQLAQLESLAAQGLTIEQMMRVVGIGVSTYYDHKDKIPAISEAIERGRAKGVATITNALFNKARAGDVQAIRYWLNNRDSEQWADRREIDLSGSVGTHEDRLAHLR